MTYKTVKDIICSMDRIARERGLKWMDSTMLLYALRWPESEAERILRYGGFEQVEDAYRLMERFDNEPLAEDENPRFTPVAFRLVEGGGQSARTIEKDSTHGLHCQTDYPRVRHPPSRTRAFERAGGTCRRNRLLPLRTLHLLLRQPEGVGQGEADKQGEVARMGAAHARSHAQRNRGNILNVNGVNIEYQYDGAHDARPTEHTLHGLDGLNLSGLDWMRLSHVCRLMAARDRKPKRAFVRVSGWTADRPNMRLIVDVLQDDDGTVSVPLPLISDYLLVNSGECDGRLFHYGWLDVLVQLPEHVDYGRLDETGMRVVDWLNGMADPSPEIFEDWEAISLIRQNVYEDEPTGLADLLRSATRTERDECFDMLEQVETGRPL